MRVTQGSGSRDDRGAAAQRAVARQDPGSQGDLGTPYIQGRREVDGNMITVAVEIKGTAANPLRPDGANDLPMLSIAGLGVAYHAKPVVKQSASHAISNFGLDSVLYLMGVTDRDIDEALTD